MSKKRIQQLPVAEVYETNVADWPNTFAGVVYEVCAWRSGAANSGEPCTEVHLVLRPDPDVLVALRLKSARALDELVGVLLEYRKEVWRE